MNAYKPQEFAEMIGVSVKTLQRWDKDEKLKAFRTPSDRRYYTDEHLEAFNRGRCKIVKELQDGNKTDR